MKKKDWQCLKCHGYFYKRELKTKEYHGIIISDVLVCPKCGGRARYLGYIPGDKRNNYCLNSDSRYYSYNDSKSKSKKEVK